MKESTTWKPCQIVPARSEQNSRSIRDVVDLVKHCPNPPFFYPQRSANLYVNTFYRAKAEKADFQKRHHNQILCLEEFIYGSTALTYAGLPVETWLHLEDPALHLSLSCLLGYSGPIESQS